jgi:amino acid transporter
MDETNGLKRVMGPIGATAVVVGAVIGAGVFFKASAIARSVGRVDLVVAVWIVCGAVSFCGALALAELAAAIPRAGGQYVYLRRAYGPLAGFLWGWTELCVLRSGAIAALAVTFATAFQNSIGQGLIAAGWLGTAASHADAGGGALGGGAVAGGALSGAPLTLLLCGFELPIVWWERGLAIAAIATLTTINIAGARWGGHVQSLTTVVKAATLLALMALPLLTGAASPALWGSTLAKPPEMGWVAGFAAAMTAAFWAYDGWNNVALISEEVREPQRNVPLALGIGLTILIALYLGVALAYHLVLSVDEVAASAFVARSACERMLGEYGAEIASSAVMVSTFGALNANLLCGPRVLFAMARDQLFWESIGQVHPRFATPHRAILAESAWAVVLILASNLTRLVRVPAWIDSLPAFAARPLRLSLETMATKATFDVLTDYVIFGSFIFYVLSVAAVFVLRWREPNLPRPYKTLGYPLLPLGFVIVSTAFLLMMLVTSPVESLAGVLFLAVGALLYFTRLKDRTNRRVTD